MKRPASFIIVFLIFVSALAYVAAGTEDAESPTAPDASAALPPRQELDSPLSDAPITRIRSRDIDLDAPIITLGVDEAGAMETPPDPVSVAWYNFSARPGTRGNAVFSGHVDYHQWGAAVFWPLTNLDIGEEVEVELADGTTYEYVVQGSQRYEVANAPILAIIGPTPEEAITLITCAGSFDPISRSYDHVLVVRAVRSSPSAQVNNSR